jgi:SAM-dependent methyltransferase
MKITEFNSIGETSTCRDHLAQWCIGAGLDIGAGGAAPIVYTAICIDKSPAGPHGGRWPIHMVRDVFKMGLPFEDDSLDYVYSSHCLEDAEDTEEILTEWCRVIRTGCYLVLFLPDQLTYLSYCQHHGTQPNLDHKHENFGIDYVVHCMPDSMRIVHSEFPVPYNPYSFELVAQKL